MFWREAAAGMSPVAYFIAKNAVLLAETIFLPIAFILPLRALLSPLVGWPQHIAATVLSSWATTGLGVLISIVFKPNSSLLVAVLVSLVLGGFVSGYAPFLKSYSDAFLWVPGLSWNRWAFEYLSLQECRETSRRGTLTAYECMEVLGNHVGLKLPCDASFAQLEPVKGVFETTARECSSNIELLDLWMLAVLGLVTRLLGLIALLSLNRDKWM